ncbi:MAG: sarcosine oxidase subunit alpha family protein, partial [Pseudomonadota bacterium]
MSGFSHRLSENARAGQTGRLIDRTRTIGFRFDGERYLAHPGDTLASALLANGVRLMGRSFKYHRPRGPIGIGSEEPNALVAVGEGDRLEPNLRATQVEVFDGLVAESQNRWPSLKTDVGAINAKVSRFLPAGFYYKTFMWPRAAWKHLYEPVIRKAAGLGPAPREPDPDTYEQIHVHCDVLVVGGGAAGITAASAAMDAGARVIIADETAGFGGWSDCDVGARIAGEKPDSWLKGKLTELAASDRTTVLSRTTVAGHYDHNYVLMLERVADHDPALLEAGAPRHRLWKVRAKEVVLASGAIERPLTFADNDRPGVMLASAVRGYATRYGVTPGSEAVIVTNNDDAYRTAITLFEAGVAVNRIVDTRPQSDGQLVDQAKALGIRMMFNAGISGVIEESGGQAVRAVKIAALRDSGRAGDATTVPCDLLAVSGGYNPAVHLFCHVGGKLVFDAARQMFVPGETRERLRVCGAANGVFDLPGILKDAAKAGELAARAALGSKRTTAPKPPKSKSPTEAPIEPIWFMPADGAKNVGNKHFLDFQNDVTAADVELAAREGYRSVEHVKRYTTLGMATDQGKTSNINALGILSDLMKKPIPEIGTTTFRPPYTPLSFGAFVGQKRGALFQPVRRTPVQDWHESKGAVFEPVGQWRRPYCYPQGSENKKNAIFREVRTVRRAVGLLDASTLGKIEVKGPDAATFLDLIYTNMMSTLKVGRCRYGLMCSDQGFLFDDGVVVRLADDHFLCHTTSGGADHVVGWLERWHQTEWPHLKLFISPVTEQWAQFAVAGPQARAVLDDIGGDMDISSDALPFMAMTTGTLGGVPVRLYRISFSGELSYEVACPAGLGAALWEQLVEKGQKHGAEPYGTEAL